VNARDELAAFSLDCANIERLIDQFQPADGTPLEDPAAYSALVAARHAARSAATRAAVAYVAELRKPKKAPTLEDRRARVADVYAEGFRAAFPKGQALNEGEILNRAAAYALGKVPK